MQDTIKEFFQQHHIPENAGFIVAISGGADSITLLHAFKYMNLKILALHCNFNLRGKESDMDEQFVKRFCDTYGIALNVKKFDTIQYANEKDISIEMAARELRYNWFREVKQKKQMDYIVVGHHADDAAETMLINFCRGTGIKGLIGIKPVNGDILRPLLHRSRADILAYINEHKLGFRSDSTNNSLDYVRNKIRHLIIPVFKEINPSFLATVHENAEAMKEAEQLYLYAIEKLRGQAVKEEYGETLIHIDSVMKTPAPYTLLYEILKPFGFNKTQIRDIYCSNSSIPGKQFISDQYILTKDRTYWRIFDNTFRQDIHVNIEKEGEYSINGKTYRFTVAPVLAEFEISKRPDIASLDADKTKFPLLLRNWQTGDYFCPIGMKKSKKKLSNFFTNQKFSTKQKKECILLLASNKVAWVTGYRIDDRFKITDSTKQALIIEIT